jgi:hypothetical protein
MCHDGMDIFCILQNLMRSKVLMLWLRKRKFLAARGDRKNFLCWVRRTSATYPSFD